MNARFAARMKHVKPSAIRDLLQFGADPSIISFGGGYPDATLFPLEQLEAVFTRSILDHGQDALQYTVSNGSPHLRAQIAGRMANEGVHVHRGQRPHPPWRAAGSRSRGQVAGRRGRRDHHRRPDVPRWTHRVQPVRAGVRARSGWTTRGWTPTPSKPRCGRTRAPSSSTRSPTSTIRPASRCRCDDANTSSIWPIGTTSSSSRTVRIARPDSKEPRRRPSRVSTPRGE